jgi:hypothetical protein
MSRKCPRCQDPLSVHGVCGSCGFGLKASAPTTNRDPEYLRCEWVALADRCRYVGTITADTRGGGPWFCVGHFGCTDPAHGERIVDESQTKRGDDWSAGTIVGNARARFVAKLEAQAEREAIQADA